MQNMQGRTYNSWHGSMHRSWIWGIYQRYGLCVQVWQKRLAS